MTPHFCLLLDQVTHRLLFNSIIVQNRCLRYYPVCDKLYYMLLWRYSNGFTSINIVFQFRYIFIDIFSEPRNNDVRYQVENKWKPQV